jgi:hypothetical protein
MYLAGSVGGIESEAGALALGNVSCTAVQGSLGKCPM